MSSYDNARNSNSTDISETAGGGGGGSDKKKNHNKYRRDKPWDNEEVLDHWDMNKYNRWKTTTEGDGADGEETMDRLPGGRLLEESSFATLFPKYREIYLRQIWPIVTRALDKVKIACELNLIEGSMSVRTTRKTSDPYVILKARDLLKLISRSIPVTQAIKILSDECVCEVVKIGGMVRNKDRFVKRRQRLIGPDGSTLKALEILTNCFILVQGNTVSIMGDATFQGIKQARRIVVDCMNNIHPVYNIKRLMIQKELAKDPALKEEDWSRFLPSFKKKNVQTKRPKNNNPMDSNSTNKEKSKKKAYTPFPPAQTPRKVDLQLDTGEYFIGEQKRKTKRLMEKKLASKETSKLKREAYEMEQGSYEKKQAPSSAISSDEKKEKKSSKKKRKQNEDENEKKGAGGVDLQSIKDKFRDNAKSSKKNVQFSDYVV